MMARHGSSASVTLLAVLLAGASPSGSGQLLAEDARPTWPVSARAGETLTLQRRPDLVDSRQFWSSFGATLESATPEEKLPRLRLPADAPLGIGVLWLGVPKGAPEPLLLLVDDLPSVMKVAGRDTPERAQCIEPPLAVDGFVDSRRADYYKFSLRAGESLSVEVFAARLASKLDAKIRLLDPSGQELAYVDDSPGLAGDCRLRHTATVDGPVVLELSDIGYDGGRSHYYHLRLGDFPLIHAVFPPVAKQGTAVQWQATGEAIGGLAPRTTAVTAPHESPLALAVRFADGKPAAFGEIISAETAAVPESEPNDTPEQANAVEPQCMVAGQFGKPGDRDIFQLSLTKNRRYRIAAEMRRFGSPGDLYMRVETLKGELVAESDNLKADEAELDFTAREDGPVRLSVEELNLLGGLGQVYALQIGPTETCFDLQVTGDRFFAAKGASFTMRVASKRRPGNEPIALELVGCNGQPLPGDWKVEDTVIAKGKSDTQLKVTIPADALAGSLHMARILGRCRHKEVDYQETAVEAPAIGKSQFAALPRVPTAMRSAIAIGVGREQ